MMSEAEVERMNALAKGIVRDAEANAAARADDYRARWNPEERFRLYLVPRGKTPDDRIEVVATKTWEGIGPMLRLMIEEGEIDAGDRTAVLDTSPWEAGYPGTWVVGSLA